MLGRRALLRGLAATVLAALRPATARPAGRSCRVGVLRPAPSDARFQRDFDGFRDALREGGYAEGVNLTLEYRLRPGPSDAILGLAGELVRLPVDVIAAISPVAVAAADFERAVQAAVRERAGALVVLSSPVFTAARREVASLTGRSRLPSIMAFPGYAEDGGLIGYGPDLRRMFEQAGRHVVRVLKGAAPREIPVERPTGFSLLINQKTAQGLGLVIPPSLLARADEVVQR